MALTVFSHRDPSPAPAVTGPLAGTRIVVQPNLSVRGWPAEAGSKALRGFTALGDATLIGLLRRAGALIVGSSHMGELGFGLAGDTLARAVSIGDADLGIMTDTMGEARVAAAGESLMAFKPSSGIVSRLGLAGTVPSMEVPAVVGKDLLRIGTALEAICARDENDFSMTGEDLPDFSDRHSMPRERTRVGVAEEYLQGLDAEEKRAMETALATMEAAGFTVRSIAFSHYGLLRTVHNIIGSVEASSSAGKYDGVRYGHRTVSAKNWNEMYLKTRGESFGTLVKSYLFQGAFFQFIRYDAFEDACRVRRAIVEQTVALMGEIDCMAFLTASHNRDPRNAATVDEVYDAFGATLAANVTGRPSVQLPGIARTGKRDFGLQLMGGYLSDPALLARAARLTEGAAGR